VAASFQLAVPDPASWKLAATADTAAGIGFAGDFMSSVTFPVGMAPFAVKRRRT